MSNNSWKQYGGLSKVDSLNTISVGTIVADQFISRSANPTYQVFNGTIEVTVNLLADIDVQVGNSTFIKKDLFVTGNTYANNKIFLGGNQPLPNDTSFVAFSKLPVDSSYSFIYGNFTNIGINTVAPNAVFHITGSVPNILTVESSFNNIRNIIAQNKNKRGIVVSANDSTSNIAFFNDTSTNLLNNPNANINYDLGGILSLQTTNQINTFARSTTITSSGGIFKLSQQSTSLDSCGNILFNTSGGYIFTGSGGVIKLDPAFGSIRIDASGDFLLNSSGGILALNKNTATMSSTGSVILNSSGGVFQINSNQGTGQVEINSGNTILNSKYSQFSTFLTVTTPNHVGRGVSGEMYNATMTLYDNSNSTFLPNVYNNSSVNTGNALTVVAVDPSSNTFLRIVAPKNKMGAAFGGGIFPNDYTRSMSMMGLTDICGNYIPSQTTVAGNNKVSYLSTVGINTFSPFTEKYVMDINGPTRIGNGEIHTFLNTNNEIKKMSFSKTYPTFGLVAGTSVSATTPHVQYVYFTKDGGITWTQSQVDPINAYRLSDFNIVFNSCSVYDNKYAIIAGNQNYIFYTNDGGVSWYQMQNYLKNTTLTDNIYRDTKALSITTNGSSIRIFNAYKYNNVPTSQIDTYTAQIRFFDIPIANLSTTLNGGIYQITNFTEVSSTIDIVTADSGPNYIYFAGNGISKYTIASPENGGIYVYTNSGATYNNIFAYSDTCVITVGLNILSFTNDGQNWTDIITNSNNFANIILPTNGMVNLKSVYIYDSYNAVAVGDNGVFIYTTTGFSPSSWNVVSMQSINTSGMGNRVIGSDNYLCGIIMQDINSFVIADVTKFYNNVVSNGASKIQYCFLPNLLNRANNRVFDVSGNMYISGDVNVNDGGKISSNNETFTILNETVNQIRLGSAMSRLYIGNDNALTNIYGYLYTSKSTHHQGDVSINSRLMVQGDVSLNSQLFVNNDVSFNRRLFVGGDVSMNMRLFLTGDASFNGRLFVSGDVSMNARLAVTNDVSLNQNLNVQGKTIFHDDVSMNQRLFVYSDVSFNNRLFVEGDVSFNGRLNIQNDVSMNTRLAVAHDVSFNRNFQVFGKTILGDDVSMNQRVFISGDVSMNSRLSILGDVSMNGRLNIQNDVSMNTRLAVAHDVSFNRNFQVFGKTIFGDDVSMNQRVFISGDVSMNSRLSIQGDVSLNQKLEVLNKAIFHDDISMNQRIFVGGDASFNSRLSVLGDVSMNGRLNIQNDVSMNTRLAVAHDVSFNRDFQVFGITVLNGDVSMNNHLFLANDASFGGNFFIPGTILTTTVTPGTNWTTNTFSSNFPNTINVGIYSISSSETSQYIIFCVGTAVQSDGTTSPNNGSNVYFTSNFGNSWILLYYTNVRGVNISKNGQYVLINGYFNTGLHVSSSYGNSFKVVSITGLANTNNFFSGNYSMSNDGKYMIITSIGSLIGGVIGASVNNTSGNFVSSDYGNTWTTITKTYGNTQITISNNSGGAYYTSAISGNGQYMLLAGGYLSSNYGNWWSRPITTNTAIPPNYSISYTGQYMLIDGYYSNDYGLNWIPFSPSVPVASTAISSDGQFWLIGQNLSIDSGKTFIAQSQISNTGANFITTNGQYFLSATTNIYSLTNVITHTTSYLGIGVPIPQVQLDVSGDFHVNNRAFIDGDVSMNSRLSIAGDVSFNRNFQLFGQSIFGNDVSMNTRLFVRGDVSFNSRLFVQGDVSMNGRLNIQNDVSMNTRLSVLHDVSFNRDFQVFGQSILNGDVSMNQRLFVSGDVSFNSRFSVLSDVSFNQRLFVQNDVSMNSKLSVFGDVSFNSGLFVKGKTVCQGDLSLNGSISLQGGISVGGVTNISVINSNNITTDSLTVTTLNATNVSQTGDAVFVKRLFVASDVSFSSDLFVKNDVSFNNRFAVGSDVSFNRKFQVFGQSILNGDVSMNNRLFVLSDTSLNGNLYVNLDTSLKGGLSVSGISTFNNTVNLNSQTNANNLTVAGVLSVGNFNPSGSSSIGGDSSVSQRLFIYGDASFNNNLFSNGDVSFNRRLIVGGDVSFNARLAIQNDVSMNNRLAVAHDVSFNRNFQVFGKSLFQNDVSINSLLSVLSDVSLNRKFQVLGQSVFQNDVSINTRIFVGGDVSMNSRLSVLSDVSLNSNFQVIGQSVFQNDISLNTRFFVGGDVSLNSRLSVLSDVSLNRNFQVLGQSVFQNDVSINTRIFVGGDVSMNSRLSVLSDVSLNRNFQVIGQSIFQNDVSLNTRFFVGGDVSFNSRLSVLSDVSLGRSFQVIGQSIFQNDVSLNTRLFVGGDVSMNSRLSVLGDVSFNRGFQVRGQSIFQNDVSLNTRLFTSNINVPYVSANSASSITIGTWNNSAKINISFYGSDSGNSFNYYIDNLRSNLLFGNSAGSVITTSTDNNLSRNLAVSNNSLLYLNPFSGFGLPTTSLLTSDNTAIGYNSIKSLDVGHHNTAIGSYSMSNIGLSILGGGATGSLYNAPSSSGSNFDSIYSLFNVTSSYNTVVGYNTMNSQYVGSKSSSNTVIGSNAFSNFSATSYGTYTQNTFIGFNAQPIFGLLSNQIVLGTASETTYIPGMFNVTGDASFNSRLFVLSDVSLNKRVFIGGDVSMNQRLSLGSDVSFNRNFQVFGQSIFQNDVSLNTRFFVGGDVSFNSRLSVLSDVSLNRNFQVIGQSIFQNDISLNTRFFVGGDVSMNSRLSVLSDVLLNRNLQVFGQSVFQNDISLNTRFFVGGDVSMNSRLSVGSDVSMGRSFQVIGQSIFQNDISLNTRFFVGGDVSMNSRLSILSDVSLNRNLQVFGQSVFQNDISLNTRFFVGGDVSMNSRLSVLSDVSLNRNFQVFGQSVFQNDILLNTRLFVGGDVSLNRNLQVFGITIHQNDISLNTRLFVGGDVSMNSRLSVLSDVSMNRNFQVLGQSIFQNDVSLNRTFIGSDLTVYGRLNVNNYTNTSIINMTTTNYSLIITEDMSLNGRLVMGGDVSMNQRLSVQGDVSFNGRLNIQNDVSMNTRLAVAHDVSFNRNFQVFGKSILNNDVSMNNSLTITQTLYANQMSLLGDLNLSNRLSIAKDVSANSNFQVALQSVLNGDVSMNNRLFLNNLVMPNSALTINNNLQGNQARLFINLIGGSTSTGSSSNGIFNLFLDNYRDNLTFGDNAGAAIVTSSSTSSLLQFSYTAVLRNLAISKNALNSLGGSFGSSSADNVAIGHLSMTSLPLGHSNTAIGSFSVCSLGTTNNSSYVPPAYTNDGGTSNYNTVVGFNTMNNLNILTSSSNTVIGAGAFTNGIANGNYSYNTFIGYNSSPIYGLKNNQIVLGTSAESAYIPGSFNVLGDVSMNQRVFMNNIVLPANNFTINNTNTSNFQSRLIINMISGSSNFSTNNLFIDNSRDNLTFGDNAGALVVFSSASALLSSSSTAVLRNLAISKNALNSLGGSYGSSSSDNIAIGFNSMTSLPLGHSNTAVGNYSMPTLGSSNSYFPPGFFSDGITSNNNTVIGFNTMNSTNIQTPSNNNTVIGANAFSAFSSSIPNSVYNNNTFIGYNSGPVNNIVSNQIVLGTTAETTYIPGKFSVLGDVSLNQRVFFGQDVTLNQRLFVSGNVTTNQNLTVGGIFNVTGSFNVSGSAYSTNSIPSNAINGLETALTAALGKAQASSSVASVTADILPFDGENNFGTNWTQLASINNATHSWTSIAMSLTGEYQTAVDYGPSFESGVGGYIYTSLDYGNTWIQRAVLKTWIAVTMSYTGQYQTASFATGTTAGFIYISSNYGVNWNQSPGSPNATVNNLTSTSAGDIQYASVNGSFFLKSTNYGVNWFQSTINGTGSGQWQTISTNSNGQFLCFAGSSTVIFTSADFGVTVNTAGDVPANWNSSSVSYSGKYMILSAGAFTASNTIVKLGSSGTESIPGNLYMSSNFGSSFFVVNPSVTTQWTSVAMAGTGQYIIATTQDAIKQNVPGPIYTSLNYGLTWSINPNAPLQDWFSSAISSTGQYITAVSPGSTSLDSGYIYTSITPYYSQAISGYLTTNNLNATGTTNLTGSINPLKMLDDSLVTTGQTPLDFVDGFASNWTTPSTNMSTQYGLSISMSITGQYQTIVTADTLWNSNNYGITWSRNSLIPISNRLFQSISISSSGQYQYTCISSFSIAGGAGAFTQSIYSSSDFGINWTENPISTSWSSISTSYSGQYVVATAYNASVYLSSNYGKNYNVLNTSTSGNVPWVSCCISSSGQYIYIASYTTDGFTGGLIYSSNDYGISFLQSFFSAIPWQKISCSACGKYIAAASSRPATAGYIWISTNYGRPFNLSNNYSVFTTNYGTSFVQSSAPQTFWQSVFTSASGRYMIATAQGVNSTVGSIYSSVDFGKTWKPKNSFDRIFNDAVLSGNGQYITYVSSSQGLGVGISVTPYAYLSISNNLYVGSTNQFRIDSAGNITTSGTITTGATTSMPSLTINSNGAITGGTAALTINNSNQIVYVYGNGQVSAVSFNATSDQRIKTNIIEISASFALDTLRKLQPVSFKYISKNADSRPNWGFIAQQVETVLDYTISKTTNYIPNIHEQVDINGNTVVLNNKYITDLSFGDYPIKLQFLDASNNVIYKTIDKVIDDKTFTVTELFENNDCDDLSLFLYGQEVNDFLTINKDSIFTITTSALQQVDKELQETKQIVAKQQAEIEELKSCYNDLLERLRTAGIP